MRYFRNIQWSYHTKCSTTKTLKEERQLTIYFYMVAQTIQQFGYASLYLNKNILSYRPQTWHLNSSHYKSLTAIMKMGQFHKMLAGLLAVKGCYKCKSSKFFKNLVENLKRATCIHLLVSGFMHARKEI